MNNFNNIVLQISLFLLIICLTLIGWGIFNTVSHGKLQYPPISTQCPDNWLLTNNSCNNINNLGINKETCKSINVKDLTTDCKKYIKAADCNTAWSGIYPNNTELINCCNKTGIYTCT